MKSKSIAVNRYIQNYWISDARIGNIKRKVLFILKKRYQFAEWHLAPINDRPYAREVVRSVQEYADKGKINSIVEIGCGLGSIVGNIKVKRSKLGKRIGVDISDSSLRAARLLHPFVTFVKGTFHTISVGQVDCLIMVNFIHRIPEERLRREMRSFLSRNKVDLIVLDTFKRNDNTEYLYSHNGEYLFEGNYRLAKRSKSFSVAHGAKRYIEYWERM